MMDFRDRFNVMSYLRRKDLKDVAEKDRRVFRGYHILKMMVSTLLYAILSTCREQTSDSLSNLYNAASVVDDENVKATRKIFIEQLPAGVMEKAVSRILTANTLALKSVTLAEDIPTDDYELIATVIRSYRAYLKYLSDGGMETRSSYLPANEFITMMGACYAVASEFNAERRKKLVSEMINIAYDIVPISFLI